jgi:hypothetical protein
MGLISEAKKLIYNTKDSAQVLRVSQNLDDVLSRQLCAQLGDTQHVALYIYFYQILNQESAVLDLRQKVFTRAESKFLWQPATLWVTWDKDFLNGLRHMYLGFYTDNMPLFDQGLHVLGMFKAKQAFIDIFGADEQSRVEFNRKKFLANFNALFSACLKESIKLHPQFLCLGLYLATLYDHLDHSEDGQLYDVRKIFNLVLEQKSGS